MTVSRSIGTGAVGLHDAKPIIRKRPDLCADHGHPGVTFHPREDKTWCLCGDVIRDGNHHTHAACCGGPLSGERRHSITCDIGCDGWPCDCWCHDDREET